MALEIKGVIKTNVIRARVDNVVSTLDKSISISFILRVVENSCSQVTRQNTSVIKVGVAYVY